MNRELESIVPQGWKFLSADFSLMAARHPNAQGMVMFVRDDEGRKAWHALPDELKESTALYANGRGVTLHAAFRDAAIQAAEVSSFCGLKVVIDQAMAPNEIRLCNCNQGRLPCTCKPIVTNIGGYGFVDASGKSGKARDV